MVPYKLHMDEVSAAEGLPSVGLSKRLLSVRPLRASLRNTLAYLASFSLGSLMTAPGLLIFAAVREATKNEAVKSGKLENMIPLLPSNIRIRAQKLDGPLSKESLPSNVAWRNHRCGMGNG